MICFINLHSQKKKKNSQIINNSVSSFPWCPSVSPHPSCITFMNLSLCTLYCSFLPGSALFYSATKNSAIDHKHRFVHCHNFKQFKFPSFVYVCRDQDHISNFATRTEIRIGRTSIRGEENIFSRNADAAHTHALILTHAHTLISKATMTALEQSV